MRIGICDDDPVARQKLAELVQQQETGMEIQTYCYASAREMLAAQVAFDLVFLDIELAEMDGIALAEALIAQLPELLVIFVSAYPRYVAQSYRLKTFQFLFKPIDERLFQQELRRALRKFGQEHGRYRVMAGQQALSLRIQDMVYLESQGRKLHIHLAGGDVQTINQRIGEAAQRLGKFHFYRCSQSYLVNLRYVSAVAGNTVTVTAPGLSVELSLSRTYGKAFRQHYRDQLPRRW